MKVKINKRLIIGILTLFIIAVGISLMIYKEMDKRTVKEPTLKVVVFQNDVDPNVVLGKNDIRYVEYPKSLVPSGAILEHEDAIGKKMSIAGFSETVVLKSMLTERGEIKGQTDELWLLSLKVEDVSDFIGLQLKMNEIYYLSHLKEETYEELSSKVKVLELVDSYGNKVVGTKQEFINSIVIGVTSKEEHDLINKARMEGKIILSRAPKTVKKLKSYDLKIYDHYNELMQEKLKGGTTYEKSSTGL